MSATRTCGLCAATVGATEWCHACETRLADHDSVRMLTADERAAEMRLIAATGLTVPFPVMHGYIEALVGRPVYTHELGTNGFDLLVREILSGRTATFNEVVAKIPPEKLVLVGSASTPEQVARLVEEKRWSRN